MQSRVPLRLIFALLLGLALVLSPGLAPIVSAQDELPDCGIDLDSAQSWLLAFQSEDGGFSNGFSPQSDLGATADAVIAIARTGLDLDAFTRDGNTPLGWLEGQIEAGAVTNAGQWGKVLAAVVAAGQDPTAFGGTDVVARTLRVLDRTPDDSGYLGMALALLALHDAGAELPEEAVDALVAARSEEGALGFAENQTPDSNTTALLAMVAAATDRTDVLGAALDYLKPIQNEDGGWPYQNPSDFGTESDVNSTALVIQTLIAAQVQLDAWNNPHEALRGYQLEDGSFTYQLSMPGPSLLATVAALPAACGAAAWLGECVACPIALPTQEVTPTPGN